MLNYQINQIIYEPESLSMIVVIRSIGKKRAISKTDFHQTSLMEKTMQQYLQRNIRTGRISRLR